MTIIGKDNPYSIKERIIARMNGQIKINLKNKYLGYCNIHKKYFVDVKHSNGQIRCPLCDEEFTPKK